MNFRFAIADWRFVIRRTTAGSLPEADPIVQALIKEGDAAVEPLLPCLPMVIQQYVSRRHQSTNPLIH